MNQDPSRREPGTAAFWVVAVALTAALFWPYLTFHKLYLFTGVGSDTVNALYPRLVHLADHLRAWGLTGWSFREGLGQAIFGRDLGDPFNALLLALGADRLGYGLGWVEAAKVLVGGGLFFAFLGRLGLSPLARAVGALCFAFSGFMMVGGGWYVFSTVAVYLALVLYAFERGFGEGRWGLLPLAFCLIGLTRPVSLYTHGMFLGAYATARHLATARAARALPGLWARLAGLAVLGAAMSAVLLNGQLRIMAQSPRAAGQVADTVGRETAKAFHATPAEVYATMAARLFGNDLFGTGSGFHGWVNYLEAPLLYVGLPALLLCPLAFPLLSRRERWAWGGLLAVFAVILAVPELRLAFWLHLGDYKRCLGLFVALALLLPALFALDRIDRGARPNRWVLAVAPAVLIALLVLLPMPAGSVSLGPPRAALAGFLLAYAVVLGWVRLRGMGAGARWALLGLVAVELALAARPAVDLRPTVSAADVARGALYGDASARAVAELARVDPGFYRVDKTFSSGPSEKASYNDAMVQGYNGTSVYDNFGQGNYVRFLADAGVLDPTRDVETRWIPGLFQRPLLETLVSVKYRIGKVDDPMTAPFLRNHYALRARIGDVVVLENRAFLPLGFAYDRYLDRAVFGPLSPAIKDLVLLQAVVVDDPDTAAAHGLIPLTADRPLEIEAPLAARRAEAMTLTGHTPGHIAGTVTVAGPRLLFLSIPFDPGWQARVDGAETPTVRVDGGLTGLYLDAGRHTVTLDYRVPGLGASAALSAAACGVWGVLFLRRREGKA